MGAKLVTDLPENQPVVASLQYVHESARTDQSCGNCQFYTPGEGGLGKCQLFVKGLVREQGWCASWVAKQTT
jgi:hypothetical protein